MAAPIVGVTNGAWLWHFSALSLYRYGDMEDSPPISPAYEELVEVVTKLNIKRPAGEKVSLAQKLVMTAVRPPTCISGPPRRHPESSAAPCQYLCA